MVRRLTKQDILEGVNRREGVYIKEYDAEVLIRPLTDGELTQVFAALGNITLKEDGMPDLSKVEITKNLEALRLASSMGMIEPRLGLDEVAGMKFGVPEYIGMKVLELSGVSPSEKKRE